MKNWNRIFNPINPFKGENLNNFHSCILAKASSQIYGDPNGRHPFSVNTMEWLASASNCYMRDGINMENRGWYHDEWWGREEARIGSQWGGPSQLSSHWLVANWLAIRGQVASYLLAAFWLPLGRLVVVSSDCTLDDHRYKDFVLCQITVRSTSGHFQIFSPIFFKGKRCKVTKKPPSVFLQYMQLKKWFYA